MTKKVSKYVNSKSIKKLGSQISHMWTNIMTNNDNAEKNSNHVKDKKKQNIGIE